MAKSLMRDSVCRRINNRADRLGGAYRSPRILTLFIAVGIVCCAALGADRNTPKTLDGERLVLRDKQGKAKILMEISPSGEPSLKLLGKEGNTEIEAVIRDQGGAQLNLYSRKGKGGVFLTANSFGASQLEMMDGLGTSRLTLVVSDPPNHSANVIVCDEDGIERIHFGMNMDGLPHLIFMNGQRVERLGMGFRSKDETDLSISDSRGRKRLSLSERQDGPATMIIKDAGGKTLSSHPGP